MREILQVDRCLHDVAPGGTRRFQDALEIFHYSVSLLDNTRLHHLTGDRIERYLACGIKEAVGDYRLRVRAYCCWRLVGRYMLQHTSSPVTRCPYPLAAIRVPVPDCRWLLRAPGRRQSRAAMLLRMLTLPPD